MVEIDIGKQQDFCSSTKDRKCFGYRCKIREKKLSEQKVLINQGLDVGTKLTCLSATLNLLKFTGSTSSPQCTMGSEVVRRNSLSIRCQKKDEVVDKTAKKSVSLKSIST